MVVLALVLLILVLLFSVAIVLSNPDVYQLSLFRVLVPVTSAGVFFTGFGAALVTIIAVLLLRTGIRRSRETRRRLRAAEAEGPGRVDDPAGARGAEPAGTDTGRPENPPSAGSGDRATTSSLELEPSDEPDSDPADRRPSARADDRDRPRL